jgi:nicotinamidase-related amidase/alkylated DNA repair dioxygenase AlkB
MFPFDQTALPHLTTRKALLAIDLQADFLAEDGALHVTEPEGWVGRTAGLITSFRQFGDVFWVRSEFDKHRALGSEQILAADEPPSSRSRTAPRRRRTPSQTEASAASGAPADPEAFLSHPPDAGELQCVRPGTPGCELAPLMKAVQDRRDVVLTKSHYSAFQSGRLLQILRGKFVTELFLCGSLTNIGVYATAMDAAKYGYAITIVEDCCGYRSELRQSSAVQLLVDHTGCEVATREDAIGGLQPKTKSSGPAPSLSPSPSPRSMARNVLDAARQESPPVRDPQSPQLSAPLGGLSLAGGMSAPRNPRPQASAQPPQPKTSASPASGQTTSPSVVGIGPGAGGPPPRGESLAIEAPGYPISEAKGTTFNPPHDTDATPSSSTPKPTENIIMAEQDEIAAAEGSGPICEGDTGVIYNLLPEPLVDGIFEKVRDEVRWQRMMHQGGEVPRLVAVQGEVAEDGSQPVYRHPADESPPLLPFTPVVLEIKAETEKYLGHPLNHVLIQFYRDGNDYISEHSDKTLDIVPGSYIANVSLGAERTMVLRTKRVDKDPSKPESTAAADDTKRQVCRAKLPHNSLCRMGLVTNMRWLHAIRQDKRADRDKSAAELAYSSGRISLTFRQIGTFLDRDGTTIWGQGATGKTRAAAKPVINGQSPEAIRMLQAFGTENHASTFDWKAHYGGGFDVLHISNSPRLFASADPVVNMRVGLMLAHHGISHAKGSMGPTFNWKDGNPGAKDVPAIPENLPMKFADNDAAKTTVQGDVAIMLYLDAVHGRTAGFPSQPALGRKYSRFQQALALLDKWRGMGPSRGADGSSPDLKPLKRELAVWDSFAGEETYLAGSEIGLVDFTAWPALHDIVRGSGADVFDGLENLQRYYEVVKSSDAAVKVLGGSPAGS